jgi:hypothetical protein
LTFLLVVPILVRSERRELAKALARASEVRGSVRVGAARGHNSDAGQGSNLPPKDDQ